MIQRTLSSGTVWDYVGGMILKNGEPYQIMMPNGRAVYEEDIWHYEFEIRDHLGNLRVGFRESDGRLQKTQMSDYMPFGIPINQQIFSPKKSNYTYHGHESFDDFELRMTGVGARCYNQTIGRFLSNDALTESTPGWTGYRLGYDNPVNVTDPTGNNEETHVPSLSTSVYYSDGYATYESRNSTGALSLDGVYRTVKSNSSGTLEQALLLGQMKGFAKEGITNLPARTSSGSSSESISDLPDGRKIWELSPEEMVKFSNREGRRELFGGDFDIQLTVAERAYLVGQQFTVTLPAIKGVGPAVRGLFKFSKTKNGFQFWVGRTRFARETHPLNPLKGRGTGSVPVDHINIGRGHIIMDPSMWGIMTKHKFWPFR